MIKTKKGILRLFLFFSILCFGVLNVEAESIDISKTSSITLVYQYENEKFSNVNASLYQLATFDINGQYKFNNLYEDVTFDPVGITSSDLNLKATEIEKFISENNLQPNNKQQINQNGIANFKNLIPGMYLVHIDSTEVGNYRYSTSPMLVSIPILENQTYKYDIEMNVKIERNELEQEITSPSDAGEEGKIDTNPNTLDNIMLYVLLMMVSAIVILGVVYVLRNKEGDKNEKKK